MEKKKKYNVLAVIKRMLAHLWEQDRKQYGRIFFYTLAAAVYPFMAVVLPKIAIGILEQGGDAAAKNLIVSMAVYFIIAGVLAISMNYLESYIQTRNMRIRLMYLGDLAKKLQTMDYCYHEDAKFFEENDKAMEAGSSNVNGIEGLYNKLSELPAKLLAMLGMVVMAGSLSPLLLLALVGHVVILMLISKWTHDYEYARKEEQAKIRRKLNYYQRTTQDFSYGKDIRIFNLRNRIMENYQEELNAHLKLFAAIYNREFLLGLLGIGTLLLTNVLTYGTLVQRVLNGMPVSSFTMYVTLVTTLSALMLDFGKDLAFVWNEGEYVNDFYKLLDKNLVAEGDKMMADVMEKGENESLEIVFDHVTFRYPGTEKNIFTDLNFTTHAGERLAIEIGRAHV